MTGERGGYFRLLSQGGKLPEDSLTELLNKVKHHMVLKEIPPEIIGKRKITNYLSKLFCKIASGNPSWQGLVIGFPGTKSDLSNKNVSTPYLRMLLYPILDLSRRIDMPCIYLLGERFSDVFLRKFRLLSSVTPHVIILSYDLLHCLQTNSGKPPKTNKGQDSEAWFQNRLCQKMLMNSLTIPTLPKPIHVGLISYEVPCYEGTENPERLDILGYDLEEKSLVAFEIKGPKCGRVELENLFLQGIEHRNFLEENKMAIKFLVEGPTGKKINTRKRVRLVLGFVGDEIPPLFFKLKENAIKKDPYLRIDFCKIVPPHDNHDEIMIVQIPA